MPSPNSDPNPKRRGHSVRVVSCYASMCGGPSGCAPMAVLSFIRGQQILEPYLLSILQAHVLVRDLIRVLESFKDRDDPSGDTMIAEGLALPSIPMLRSTKARSKQRLFPSRRPDSPTGPIQATDVWQLHSMLKNVKNHDDFLKLIGAEPVAEDSPDLSDDAVTPPSLDVPAERTRKSAKSSKKRTPKRSIRKRKEK